MRYTLRNIPKHVDAELRRIAKAQRTSLNQVTLEAIIHGLGLAAHGVQRRDLSAIAGTWLEDPEFDAVIREQDKVDPDFWRRAV